MLRFVGEQLLSRGEELDSSRIRIGVVWKRNEVGMHAKTAEPPFMEVMVMKAQDDEVEHSLEARTVQRDFHRVVVLARGAVENLYVLGALQNSSSSAGRRLCARATFVRN